MTSLLKDLDTNLFSLYHNLVIQIMETILAEPKIFMEKISKMWKCQERLPLPISKVNPKAKKQIHFYLNGPQKVRHQLKNLSLCGETKMVSGKVSRLPPF